MKCICNRSALNEALAATATVTLTRTPKPILQCVKLTVEDDMLLLTAYDQEVGLRYRIREVETTSKGETLVPGDRLVGIVRESTDETLAFEMDEDLFHIRGADSHFQIVGQNVKEFPPVPTLEGDANLTVKVAELQKAVGQTLFAAARENTRYAINGVLWEKKGKQLKLVATDGRRLALSAAPIESSTSDDLQAIVPTKALALLNRLHFAADDVLQIKLTANQILMQTESVSISSVLVEGHFPKYEDVIPHGQDKKIELDTVSFRSAVKRAALLANLESKGIRLSVSSEGMVLSSRSPEQGEATVRHPINYDGDAMDIGFNPEFVLDALKVCGETIILELKDPSRPGVIKSGPDFQYVVMPVNLS